MLSQLTKINLLTNGASLLQCERLFAGHYKGKYTEWEQGLANAATITSGFTALRTALKIAQFTIGSAIFNIFVPLCLIPSAAFFILNKFDNTNKYFQVIKDLHTHMDQVGSTVGLVSQIALICLGKISILGCLSMITTALGMFAAQIAVAQQQETVKASQSQKPEITNYFDL